MHRDAKLITNIVCSPEMQSARTFNWNCSSFDMQHTSHASSYACITSLLHRCRLPEQPQDAAADDKQVRAMTSLPAAARQASQSTAVVCEGSPARRRRRTIDDEH